MPVARHVYRTTEAFGSLRPSTATSTPEADPAHGSPIQLQTSKWARRSRRTLAHGCPHLKELLLQLVDLVIRVSCQVKASSRTLELKNVEAGIGVGQIHEPVAIDITVAGLNHLGPVRSRVHHARWIGWHEVPHLARLKRVVNVVGAHAGVVIGGEDQPRALEGARPVFVQVMRAEVATLGAIVHL